MCRLSLHRCIDKLKVLQLCLGLYGITQPVGIFCLSLCAALLNECIVLSRFPWLLLGILSLAVLVEVDKKRYDYDYD
jgi:hypothetical protein